MFFDECKKHFDTDCLYEVLQAEQSATQQEVKKAYYKVSMKWHPDRADEAEAKADATVKFQIISRAYTILSDKEKRSVYDTTGTIDEENALADDDAMQLWRKMFKKVTEEDIKKFFQKHKGSEEEKADVIRYYNKFAGDMNKILEYVIAESGQEERLTELIKSLIADGTLKSTKKFTTSTSKASMTKRKRKAGKEAAEAEKMLQEIKKKEGSDNSLEEMILARQGARANAFDALAEKYANTAAQQKNKRGKKSNKTE